MKRYKSILTEDFPFNYKQAAILKNLIDDYLTSINKADKKKEAFLAVSILLSKNKIKFDKDEILLFLKKKYQ